MHMYSLCQDLSVYTKFLSRDLDLQPWPTFEKKLNLCINFCTERDPKRLQKFGPGVLVPLGQLWSSIKFVVT